MKNYCVYILASRKNGTLYVGVTSNLVGRVWQHRNKVRPGFTERYRVDKLVYYENHDDIAEAIRREKCIKGWKREWKMNLIEKNNSTWEDLYEKII